MYTMRPPVGPGTTDESDHSVETARRPLRLRATSLAADDGASFGSLVAGEDNLVLHTMLQFLSNRELHSGPLCASRRMHVVAARSLNPTARDSASIRWAAKAGRAAAVRALLRDERVDPAARMNEALRQASGRGHADVVKLLLRDERVDPTARDSEALRRAAERGHLDTVELLLRDGRADPSARSCTGVSMSLINGHAQVGRMLLADRRVVVTAHMVRNILHRACVGGRADSVAVLLADERFDPHVSSGMPLRQACRGGDIDTVRLLLRDGRTDPGARAGGALREACEYGRADVVRLLLADRRVDPAAARSRAVQSACAGGSVECLRLLLADGRANPGARRQAALLEACARAHTPYAAEMIALLLRDERVDPSVHRGDALRLALEGRTAREQDPRGNASEPEPVRGDVNHESLKHFCNNGGRLSVELLLRDGRVLAGGASGRLAMRAALYCRHDATVRLLLDRNRDAAVAPGYDPTENRGEALVFAAVLGHLAAVELLVPRCIGGESGAGPLSDADFWAIGGTALLAACQSGFMDVVRCLLRNPRLASMAAYSAVAGTFGAFALTAGHSGHWRVVQQIVDDGLMPGVGARGDGGPGDRLIAAAKAASPVVHGAVDEAAQYAAKRYIMSRCWETPLGFAARRGLERTVAELLAEMQGGDVQSLDVACLYRTPECVHNWRDDHVLEDACRMGHVAVVRVLLGSGSPYHSPAVGGGRALVAACANGHVEIVRLLLEDGRARAALYDGSALMRARQHGHDAVARLLARHAASATAPSPCWPPIGGRRIDAKRPRGDALQPGLPKRLRRDGRPRLVGVTSGGRAQEEWETR